MSKFKIIAIVLAVLISVFCFVACNDKKEAETTVADVTTVADTTAENATTAEDITTAEEVVTTETTTEEITTEEVTTEEETTEIPDVWEGPVLDAEYASDFTVSNAFSSNMVVQRNEHIRVWGWADEKDNGKKVCGKFMGMTAEALVENGEWVITFGARLPACTDMGNTMEIYTDKKSVKFEDVLVGDVYMVIGQSNTAYSVANHLQFCNNDKQGGSKTLDDNALIRLNYNGIDKTAGYPTRGTEEVVKDVIDNAGWTLAKGFARSNFSAIGYYSAVNILKLTDNKVPIGLIEINGNGLPIGSFVPNEVAEACKTDKLNKTTGRYITTGCNSNIADIGEARYVYNHYMYAFERYAMAGVIWYQGESDYAASDAKKFSDTFTALMTYMRNTHNVVNPDFAVFVVEFPSIYANGGKNAIIDFGVVRGSLGEIPQKLSNSYVAVSCDLWDNVEFSNNLHPNCKYEQSLRVAALAAYANCGVGTLEEATGPRIKSIEYSEDRKTAILTFENVGDGLKTQDGGTKVNGFTAINKSYSVAKATITAEITASNQITVQSSVALVGLGYNIVCNNFYGKEINLCNSYGCPASAFIIFN